MTIEQEQVRELPLRHGGDPLAPRLSWDAVMGSGERLVPYRFPNGVTGWVTTNAEDFRTALNDNRLHAKRFLGEPQPAPLSVEVPDMPGFIPSMNGPEHLRVRRLAAGDFSVKAINALRPFIEQVVDKHLDHLATMTPPVDLIRAFCLPVPSEVIAHIIGVPSEHHAEFQKAAGETIGQRDDGLADPEAAVRAVGKLHEILAGVVTRKRAEPGDDLISRLTKADPPLTDVEICGLCTNLLLAGHDTTAATTGVSVAALLEHPDQLRDFLDNPDRVPQSVEELVRFVFLVADAGAGIPRLVTEDCELGGAQLRKGDWVMPSVGAANIDPKVCPHAAFELDIDREPTPHLTFGFGPHTCLGQHLARAELQIMLTRLFTRFPTLQLDRPPTQMRWNDESFVYRMSELPVRW